jgi:hypothetical protein
MSLRVAQINVGLILLDEFDAIKNADPITFAGDQDGTAPDKLREWLDELPQKLAKAAELPPREV